MSTTIRFDDDAAAAAQRLRREAHRPPRSGQPARSRSVRLAAVSRLHQPEPPSHHRPSHFIGEEDDPYAIVARLMAAVPSGSYLVIAHAASDTGTADTQEGFQIYNQRSPVRLTPRSRQQIDRLVVGLEPVGPGVVPMSQWFEPGPFDSGRADLTGYYGLVRKP